VAQGAAFAAKARLLTGLVVPHTELAIKTYCEMSVEDAAAITDQALVDLPPDGPRPAYEIRRQRIQDHFRE
jgi:enediyne biosynthesis protein E3